MADDITTTPDTKAAGDAGKPNAFDAQAWLQARTPDERGAIESFLAFHKTPLESELHGLRTEVGRLKKAADPAIAARLSDEERLVSDMKASAVSLYGVDPKDLEDVETLADMRLSLKWMTKGAPKTPAKTTDPADADAATKDAWKAYFAQASSNGNGNGKPNSTEQRITGLNGRPTPSDPTWADAQNTKTIIPADQFLKLVGGK